MRVFSALTVLTLLTSAAAPAAATGAPAAGGLRLDSAADGGLEIRNGDALLARVALKTPALRRGTPLLREVTVSGHRLAELRVPVRGTSAEEVWIGEIDGATRRVVWSGMTGPRDADGETSLRVEATPTRVTEYQTAAGVDRCDGIPPRLFPRGYDFATGHFRPIVSLLPPPGSETLVAHRGDPAMPSGRPIADFHFVGASTTRAAGSDARGLTPPVELEDDNPATSWAEGLGGDGRGEFLTARAAAGGYAIRGLRIFPGDGASLQALRGKNRLKRFQNRARSGAGAALRRRDPRRSGRRRRPLARTLLGAAAEADGRLLRDRGDHRRHSGDGGRAAEELRDNGHRRSGDLHRRRRARRGEAAGRQSRHRARLRRAAPAGGRPRRGGRAADGRGGPQRQGRGSRVPHRGADDAGAGAEESAGRRGAGGRGDRRQREGGEADRDGARAGRRSARLGAGRPAGVTIRARRQSGPRGAHPRHPRRRRGSHGAAHRGRQRSRRLAGGDCPGSRRRPAGARRRRAGGVRGRAAAGGRRDRPCGRLARILPAAVERAPERRAEAIAALRAALAADSSFELRGRALVALGALGQLGSSGSPEAIAAPAAVSDDPVLRYLATRRARRSKSASGVVDPRPLLRAALDDQDPRVRETAAWGWGSSATPAPAARSSAAPSRSPGHSSGAPSCRRSAGCAWRVAAIS